MLVVYSITCVNPNGRTLVYREEQMQVRGTLWDWISDSLKFYFNEYDEMTCCGLLVNSSLPPKVFSPQLFLLCSSHFTS